MSDMKPPMGRRPVFNETQEVELHNFLLDCWVIGVPRTQELFGMDIQYSILKSKRKTPFADGYPGNSMYHDSSNIVVNTSQIVCTNDRIKLTVSSNCISAN